MLLVGDRDGHRFSSTGDVMSTAKASSAKEYRGKAMTAKARRGKRVAQKKLGGKQVAPYPPRN